jgi:octaprenyl-diphosphate synthase
MSLSPTTVPSLPAVTDLFAPIAGDLEAVELILKRTLSSSSACVSRLLEHLRHYRGKRLRPALLLLTARACGKVTEQHRILAAVVEMIHTATLVHDDVLDSAIVRRHVSTINAEWGNQSSILLGDFLFTHAFHLASTVDARACSIIGESTNRVCEGELQQISEQGNLDLSEDQYLDIIDGKTAELTACCCRLAAIYSDMEPEVVEGLTRYGRQLGLAFQIADDLLDLVGEETLAGKSLGTDLEQEKLTLPLIRLLRHSALETRSGVRQILSQSGNHKRESLKVYWEECDGLQYAALRAEEFAGQARAELGCLPPSASRDILEFLTERVVHRNQ